MRQQTLDRLVLVDGHLHCALNFLEQVIFRDRPDHCAFAQVDSRLRHAADTELIGELVKFHRFDHFCLDHGAFKRHLVSEHHGSRAVRSGGGGKYQQVNRVFQGSQRLARLFLQTRIALGDQDQGLE